MSNNFDEQNPTNEPNRPNVPESLAEQLGRGPQQFDVGRNPLAVPWGKMLTILDEIRYVNDRIRINTQDTASFLSKHMSELKTATQLTRDETTRSQVPGEKKSLPEPETRVHPELLTPLQRVQNKIQEQQRELLSASQATQMDRLRNMGMIDKQGNIRISGGARAIRPEELSDVIKFQRGEVELHDLDPTLRKSAVQFGKTLKAQLADTMSDEINQARGIEKLRSGNMTPAGLFRHFGSLFGMGHHMPMGPAPFNQDPDVSLGEGVADVFSRRTFSTKLGDLLQSRMEKNIAAGVEGGGMAGRIAGLLGGGSIPVLGEALIGYSLLKEFGSKIPIIGSLTQMDDQYRAMRSLGQQTGQGFQAGFRATEIDPYNLMRGGQLRRIPLVGSLLGMFDPITKQIANEIVQQVTAAGLSGDRARQLEQSVASVYKDLGLDVATTVNMIKDATRTGGESLQQIVSEMKTFDTAAHNLSVNINEYGASIANTANTLRQQGAGPTATVAAQNIMASLPLSMRNQQGMQQVLQNIQGMAPRIAAMEHTLPQLIFTPTNIQRTLGIVEQTQTDAFAQAQQIVAGQPGDPARNAATFLSTWNAPGINPFYGQQPDAILAQLGRIQRGRGLAGVQRIQTTTANYQRRLQNLRGTQMKPLSELSDEELAAHGIKKVYGMGPILHGGLKLGKPVEIGGPGLSLNKYEYQGRILDPTKLYQVPGDEGKIPLDRLADARRDAIKQVAGLLSKSQYRTLQQHLRDRGFDFAAQLQNYMTQTRTHRNQINTPFGVIRLEFGPKAKKLGLQATVTQNAVASGNVPSNQAYPYEPLRLDPFSP